MSRMRTPILLIAALSTVTTATAGPGALEISETCAVHTGCFAGDSAGYPVTISSIAPGSSFVLTSDLSISDENITGIEITKDSVQLDLAGFTILGINECSGDPNSCDTPGTGNGIDASTVRGIDVRNGAISRAGQRCIELGDESRVDAVRVDQCGSVGIELGNNSVLTNSIVSRAIGSGASVGTGSVVENVTARRTGGGGIGLLGGSGVTLENVVASDNGGTGIELQAGSVVRESTVAWNDGVGITLPSGAVVVLNNAVLANGNGSSSGHGIRCATSGCRIVGNTVRANSGYGILISSSASGYSDNITSANTVGTVSGGTDLGGNLLN